MIRITAVLLAAMAAASPLAAQDVAEITARADARGALDNLSAALTLTITAPSGDQRVIRADSYQKQRCDEREDRLFVFTYPPNVRRHGAAGALLHEGGRGQHVDLPARHGPHQARRPSVHRAAATSSAATSRSATW